MSGQLLARERIAYGARALNEGGLQSLPKLTFPGGVLICVLTMIVRLEGPNRRQGRRDAAGDA